ncbi:MAG: L-seryl-tRNA(Sec) selenium transferase [Acidobacteriaceae bacterium]
MALFRELPSLDELLRSPELAASTTSPLVLREAARSALSELRNAIASGQIDAIALEQRLETLPEMIVSRARDLRNYSLQAVINATGVILHTNLGRAPLSPAALAHVAAIAGDYCNLEYDLATGDRGQRDAHAQQLFLRLFSGIAYEDQSNVSTVVVNNCAAATLLALSSLARNGEVIVSRGELVEIGGSFRIPEIMAQSGATLREIGTTNRTRISDYEQAITDNTRLLMRVSRSNFAISGFTEQPSLDELVLLGRRRRIPVFEDHGNGVLVDLQAFGVMGIPTVQKSLRAGMDVISYSGDKLLGGPQAGLLSGRASLIAALRANPLFRALRVDKLTYAALQATLTAYLDEDYSNIPTLRMLRWSADDILIRAEALKCAIEHSGSCSASIVRGESVIGGGTPPTATLPTYLVALDCESAEQVATMLRAAGPPVITRITEDKVILDLRTVFPEQDAQIVRAINNICNGSRE